MLNNMLSSTKRALPGEVGVSASDHRLDDSIFCIAHTDHLTATGAPGTVLGFKR